MNVKNTLSLVYMKFSMNKRNVLMSLMLLIISTVLLKSGTEVMAVPGITGSRAPGVPP